MVKILVCVDGSKGGDAAAQRAIDLAKEDDTIIFAAVSDVGHYVLTHNLDALKGGNTEEKAKEHTEQVLAQYKSWKQTTTKSYEFVILVGNPAEKIVEYTNNNSNGIDLLFIGQVGLTSTGQTQLSSTSYHCIRECRCDVVVCKVNEN